MLFRVPVTRTLLVPISDSLVEVIAICLEPEV